MPAEVTDDPLGISWITSKGVPGSRNFEAAPNPALARQLLRGFANLVHPHGTLDSHETISKSLAAITSLVGDLATAGHVGKVEDITRGQIAGVLLAANRRSESLFRQILKALDDQAGALRPDVLRLLDGRFFNRATKNRDRTPHQPYSEAEWQRLRDTCRKVITCAHDQWRDAVAAAERGADPLVHGFTFENVCWLLARRGRCTSEDMADELGARRSTFRYRHGGTGSQTRMLFPDAYVVIAYQLLFGVYTGIVPDGIDSLGADNVEWAGDSAVLLSYFKGRTAQESLNLNRNAIRLLEQWLEHSSTLRGLAPSELKNELWLRYAQSRSGWRLGKVSSATVQSWVGRQGLLGDDGKPLQIHRSRIRTTFHALRDRRAWTGSTRTRIDPNHSAQVEGDHYLSAPTAAQMDAVEDIIASAQVDMVRKAQPPIVLTDDRALEAAQRFPDLVARAGLTEQAIRELASGQRDVFVAGCADILAGQHGPKGKPCPARPWVCLLCPLAVFAPRHAPNLLRLNAYFSRQWQTMTAEEFMARFGPYAQRIEQIIAIFRTRDPAALSAAAAEVTDTDDEIPLRPEEYSR